jgi:hypothetical protein
MDTIEQMARRELRANMATVCALAREALKKKGTKADRTRALDSAIELLGAVSCYLDGIESATLGDALAVIEALDRLDHQADEETVAHALALAGGGQ